MPITFPTTLDALTNPISTDLMNSATVPHTTQHTDLNDAVEAIEAYVGVTGSAVATSLTYKINNPSSDATKANLLSPTFTGTPTLPTGTIAVTQALADNTTAVATTAFVIANAPLAATAESNYNKAVSGLTYSAVGNMGTQGITIPTLNTTTYNPTFVVSTTTYDRISIRSNLVTSTIIVRLGIYSDTNGKPDALVLDAGTVTVNASSTIFNITISQSLFPARYYLAACAQVNSIGSTNMYFTSSATADQGFQVFGAPAEVGSNPLIGWTQTGVTGAFTTAGTLTSSGSLFSMSLRAA